MKRRWLRLRVTAGGVLFSGALSSVALAEAPAPTLPPSPSVPSAPQAPDVVELKNGGMLRGTIAESVPGQSVTIVLITGETRTIPDAEVRRAGPADRPPPSVAASQAAAPAPSSQGFGTGSNRGDLRPAAVVHAAEARVSVQSDPTGNTLFRRVASAGILSGFDELCSAPCNVSLAAGTHTFSVAQPGGKPREADPVTLPAGPSTLHAAYIDRSGTRLGLALGGGIVMVGGYAWGISGLNSAGDAENPDATVYAAGFTLGSLGLIAMVVGLMIPDGAAVTVTPGLAANPANPANAPARVPQAPSIDESASNRVRNGLSGLTVTARF